MLRAKPADNCQYHLRYNIYEQRWVVVLSSRDTSVWSCTTNPTHVPQKPQFGGS